MLSVRLLCWAVLTLHATATCYHLQRTSVPSGDGAADAETRPRLKADDETNFLRNKGDKEAQNPVRQGSKGNFNHFNEQRKSCFTVLSVKRQAFLCLNSKGKLYTSVFDSNEDCRFRRVRRHKRYDMFRSCRGDVLLVDRRRVRTDLLSGSVFLKRRKTRTHHRKRRSWHNDPSDPLGVAGYPHLSVMRSWRSDPEHGGNVSKETITSVDDPLEVLLSHSARTPTLEKHRGNRKVRI